jgi:mevalonate kinase
VSKRSHSEQQSNHVGFGKLILFGEHFVVYNQAAFVGAVAAFTSCAVTLGPLDAWSTGLQVIDRRPAVPGYKDEKAAEMLHSTALVLKQFQLDAAKRAITIELGGDLCAVSGIGASAANCVSLARALADALGLSLSEERINEIAFEGEKGYHGTPSGIDNTASTYGGILRFQRSPTGPLFEPRKLAQPCRIVYASTGITASTTEVVGDVRKRREADPAWYDALAARYQTIFERADAALAACDFATIGALANENHTILQELGVSCKELDDLVLAARAAGAIGAKMSGTGRGGLMFAVASDAASQAKIHEALEKISPQVWSTSFA